MYQYFHGINLYDFLNTFSFVVFLIFNLLFINKKKKHLAITSVIFCNRITKKDRIRHLDILRNPTFCAITETVALSYIFYGICLSTFNIKVGDLLNTGANYFGFLIFAPLVLILLSILLKINPIRQLDLYSVGLGLALFVSKLGCFTWGCCAGIETEKFGMYNAEYDKVMFPVQLVEAFLALAIFFFILFYRKKASAGKIFPVYFMLFSFTRFFSEFLRMEPAVFMGLKLYQILCIIGFLVGLTQYLIVKKYGEKLNSFFDEKFKYELKTRKKNCSC